jgi:hypothetical protein
MTALLILRPGGAMIHTTLHSMNSYSDGSAGGSLKDGMGNAATYEPAYISGGITICHG